MITTIYSQSKHSRNRLLIVSFCLLSGCSAMGVHNDDKSDICYTWRSQLRDSEHYYMQSVAEGAAIGGLAGAGMGAIAAAISGGNIGAGALIGGVSGAVAGGVGGYYNAKQKDIADSQALASSVRNDILKANGEIDRTALAFSKLRDCRFAAADRIKSEFKAGRMPRDTAVKKLGELKLQFDEDVKIAQELGSKMTTRMTDFQDANKQILAKDPNARAMLDAEKLNTTQLAPEWEEPVVTKSSKHKSKSKSKHSKKTNQVATTAINTPVNKAQPSSVPTTKPPVAVEVAHVAETNQIKQKAFVDQVDQAKAQAKTAFSLEGSVSLITPAIFLCER